MRLFFGAVSTEGQLTHLQDLGFKKEDCKTALLHCKGEQSLRTDARTRSRLRRPSPVPQVSWTTLLLGSWRTLRAWQAIPEAGLTRAPAVTQPPCRGWRSRPRASASVSSTTAWTVTFRWASLPSPVSSLIPDVFA